VIQATDANNQLVTQLGGPLTITVRFTSPVGANALLAQICTVDSNDNAQVLATSVTDNGDETFTGTAQTSHLSIFELFAPRVGTLVPAAYLPLVPDGGSGPGGW
jgi:hypothetical protein